MKPPLFGAPFGLLLMVMLTISFPLSSQNKPLRLTNRALERGAQYGWSCATNGTFVATGGPNATYNEPGKNVKNSGKVLIYKQYKGKWIIHQKLTNPDLDENAWFGSGLAMNEDYLVVDAHGYSSTITDDHSHRVGRVHIYKFNKKYQSYRLAYSLDNPDPNRYGSFGDKINLKGDTLAVHYGKGEHFDKYPNRQCIAFYRLSAREKEPFRTHCFDKKGKPMYRISGDFNKKYLVRGNECTLQLWQFRARGAMHLLDSINLCKSLDIEGSISSLKLKGMELFVGFHESMYSFWGYSPAVKGLEDGDSVFRKTIVNEDGSFEKQMLLPQEKSLLEKYNISETFFKEHAQIYESYQTLARRKGGAGLVQIYDISRNQLALKQVLTASKRHPDDWFGSAIAVSDSALLVSAMGYPDVSKNHPYYKKRFAGAVFYFTRGKNGHWQEKEILRSLHQKRWDKFGFSLNNWRDFFVIGSRFDDYTTEEETESGAVYIFDAP